MAYSFSGEQDYFPSKMFYMYWEKISSGLKRMRSLNYCRFLIVLIAVINFKLALSASSSIIWWWKYVLFYEYILGVLFEVRQFRHHRLLAIRSSISTLLFVKISCGSWCQLCDLCLCYVRILSKRTDRLWHLLHI